MKKKLSLLTATLLAVLLVLIGLVGCGDDDEKDNPEQPQATQTTIVSNYTWIKWSDSKPTTDAELKDTASAWLGIYNGSLDTAPTSYTKYEWVKVQGSDGKNGTNGLNGKDGQNGFNGLNGKDGKSAYEIAMKYATESMTEVQWLASLKGDKGDTGTAYDGQDGKSAYELAIKNKLIPSTMTEVQWLKSLQGKDGANADANAVKLVSITRTVDKTTIKLKANKQGTYMVALQCYGHIVTGETEITINRVGCNKVVSQPDYFMLNGVITDTQSVISVPVVPSVMFNVGDEFEVVLDKYYADYVIVNEALF